MYNFYPYLLLFLVLSGTLSARQVTGIAAKVNGRVITTNEVNHHLTPYKERLETLMDNKDAQYFQLLNKARKDILESLIERELILSEFRLRSKTAIPDHVIAEEIQKQIRELYNNNEKAFYKSLSQAGITREQYRIDTEKKLIVAAMRSQKFSNTLPPLPEEIQGEYQKHKLELRNTTGDQISFHKIYILKNDPNNPASRSRQQRDLAKNIVKKLKKGADFGALARKHSQDSFADNGGYVKRMKRTDLSPAFAAILMETKEGDVIGPLEDAYGYTIVRVDKKYYGPIPPLSKVRKIIEDRVRIQKNKGMHDQWIKQLKEKAMIKRLR